MPAARAAAALVLVCALGAAAGAVLAAADSRPADAAAPAAAAGDQIQVLDEQVQVVLGEARRQQELLAVQRQRLAAAEAATAWLPWLVMGLLLLAVLAGWLAWRLWLLRRAPARPAAAPVAAQPDQAAIDMAQLVAAALPDVLAPRTAERSPMSAAPGVAARPGDALASRAMVGALPGTEPRPGLRDAAPAAPVTLRPVSVEELMDLDQQVDFFLALGQTQSAVDLLLGHVRATGGTSAQPYFRLLEIYREHGDEEAYERTRERFNQRFNAHAPDWTGRLDSGRTLEDYPEVLQRLQRAWPQPLRAIAEVEGLLLRRADLEPLDLPAYRELLLLQALVRDLPAAPLAADSGHAQLPAVHPPQPARAMATAPVPAPTPQPGPAPVVQHALVSLALPEVDLLLPLDDGPLDITAPRPHLADRGQAQAHLADWVFTRIASAARPADSAAPSGVSSRPMRLDLDLSDYAPAPREFTRPAAFTDVDMRRDRRRSDLGALDDSDSDPAPLPSRR